MGIRCDEFEERRAGDLAHDERVEHAVVHARLAHRHEAAAVIAPVAHGDHGKVLLRQLRVAHRHRPAAGDGLEEEVYHQGKHIAPLAVQQRHGGELVHVARDARIQTRAGDRQALAAVAVDQVDLLHVSVPQVFRVGELFGVRAEVFEEVVSRPDGYAGHRRVGKARNAVGDLVGGAVAAAGVKAHRAARLGNAAGEGHRMARRAGEHALHVQPVVVFQLFCHGVNARTAVLLPGGGIDDKNMLHREPSCLQVDCLDPIYRSIAADRKRKKTPLTGSRRDLTAFCRT